MLASEIKIGETYLYHDYNRNQIRVKIIGAREFKGMHRNIDSTRKGKTRWSGWVISSNRPVEIKSAARLSVISEALANHFVVANAR